jgi:predicted O-linked N-acetylglucosamine transferase (SPINDLY family)
VTNRILLTIIDLYYSHDLDTDNHKPYKPSARDWSLVTCDALWMGIPVITLTGNTFYSRIQAASCKPSACPT